MKKEKKEEEEEKFHFPYHTLMHARQCIRTRFNHGLSFRLSKLVVEKKKKRKKKKMNSTLSKEKRERGSCFFPPFFPPFTDRFEYWIKIARSRRRPSNRTLLWPRWRERNPLFREKLISDLPLRHRDLTSGHRVILSFFIKRERAPLAPPPSPSLFKPNSRARIPFLKGWNQPPPSSPRTDFDIRFFFRAKNIPR